MMGSIMSREIIAVKPEVQQGLVTVRVKVKMIASDSDFETELVASGGRLTVVQFTTAGCQPCVRSSKYTDVSFLHVDVQTCQAIAARYYVSFTPAFLFFRDGLRVDRYEGEDAPALEEKIARHVEENARDPSDPEGQVDQAHLTDGADNSSKLKEGLVMVLNGVAAICSVAAIVNPIFGLPGNLIKLVLKHEDDKDILLQHERNFRTLHHAIDNLSQQISSASLEIKKNTVDAQYYDVEQNLKNHFRTYKEIWACPKYEAEKKKDFQESYYGKNNPGDQNLQSLYDGVVGTTTLFGQPILEVYLEHSQRDRHRMERLCDSLKILFCIGLIPRMGYAAIIGKDIDGLTKEYSKMMKEMQKEMEKALQRCK